mmetsp:Transcript_46408/g.92075  ORF Transcript_46408/g.92075 Transcript_46408/m.92075 type:complete len:271 (-) Transcript_46408:326-1138(-)|eukprot:CAMPEP_0172717900 /NCGR_PEP_ID=MMETSP1074-20121228/72868_1 /TAXON_ID=2916 /ORGANISM="Ceratium fusus, Strain PA161109" /LENGTH=270 /DNA_ID=CAMNT_0013542953 /DNA_START=60 /DNA_END=872 /DNA_ORIENTATION=+
MTHAFGRAVQAKNKSLRPCLLAVLLLSLLMECGRAWLSLLPQRSRIPREVNKEGSQIAVSAHAGRRAALGASVALGWWGMLSPESAVHASGGSTAGKYSTIPSAKRRFYGRVRQGIYQFLSMEKPVSNGVFDDPSIEQFYAKTIVLQKGGEKIAGCMFAECITKEKRTSRWNDFRVAADLLGSGFRYDASDVNDRLPQVKLIRAFAKKVDKLKGAIEEGDQAKAQQLFTAAKQDLNRYTGMVELQPLSSEDYTHEWDTRAVLMCQGDFCV